MLASRERDAQPSRGHTGGASQKDVLWRCHKSDWLAARNDRWIQLRLFHQIDGCAHPGPPTSERATSVISGVPALTKRSETRTWLADSGGGRARFKTKVALHDVDRSGKRRHRGMIEKLWTRTPLSHGPPPGSPPPSRESTVRAAQPPAITYRRGRVGRRAWVCDRPVAYRRQWQIHFEGLAHLKDQTRGRNGMTANVEKVVVHVHRGDLQDRRPDLCLRTSTRWGWHGADGPSKRSAAMRGALCATERGLRPAIAGRPPELYQAGLEHRPRGRDAIGSARSCPVGAFEGSSVWERELVSIDLAVWRQRHAFQWHKDCASRRGSIRRVHAGPSGWSVTTPRTRPSKDARVGTA